MRTGHAEVVRVVYDPAVVRYDEPRQEDHARHGRQPYCAFVIGPEVAGLRRTFAARLEPAA